MNPMVNMIMILERELELEHQGLRRTRRWVGDVSQVTDARWYRGAAGLVSEISEHKGEVSRDVETKPGCEARRRTPARLPRWARTRRKPVCNEC